MTSSWHKSIVWVIMGWRRVISEWRRSSCPSMGLHYNSARLLIFSCDQAALRTLICVRPSVCLSVCMSLLFDNVLVILSSWNFQELLPSTDVMSMQHIWRWNDAQSLMLLRRGALLFFKVICQISRSHGSKKSSNLNQIGRFRTVTPVWIHQWLRNNAQSLK